MGVHLFGELLKEEVEKLRSGQAGPSTADMQVDLPVKAFVPETYLPHLETRLAAYTRLSAARAPADLAAARRDLEADQGPFPPEAENFFSLLLLKFYAADAGVAAITESSVQGGPRSSVPPGKNERRLIFTFREGLTPALAYAAIADNPRWIFTGSTMSIQTVELLQPPSSPERKGHESSQEGNSARLLEQIARILRLLAETRRKEAAGKIRVPKPPP